MEAVFGGALLGIASGVYMIVAGKVAGCSGGFKQSISASTFDRSGTDASRISTILFSFGLILAGLITSFVAPWGYEPYATISDEWAFYVFGGLLIGSGTYFANGCTSGHGLSGISRLSLRSFIATPIFMAAAALTAMIKSNFAVGPMVPFAAMPAERYVDIGYIVLGLFILAGPIVLLYRKQKEKNENKHNTKKLILYTGCWSGLTFGSGLAIGGMVRPSAIAHALTPQNFDFTLWILFSTGLAFTFGLYRIAEHVMKIKEARCVKQGPYDKKLMIGSVLFGVGWGLTGMCPGPILVGLVADFNSLATGSSPTGGPLLCFVCVMVGQFVSAMFDYKSKCT